MKKFSLFSISIFFVLIGCKKDEAINTPPFFEKKDNVVIIKDIETETATITYNKTLLISTSDNSILKQSIDNKDVSFDFSILEKTLNEFRKENLSIPLYFRFEIREFEPDVVVGNSKSIRAGKPLVQGIYGLPIVQRNQPIDWAALNQFIKDQPSGLLGVAYEAKKQLKLVLAVYDWDRAISDKTTLFDTPISSPPNYSQGGPLIALVGWNLDFK
ncbi:MAG: hypothetical protein U0Y10_06585 [Spirosomataceae bacterium]